MQRLILVNSKTGERLLEFEKSVEGLNRMANFSFDLITAQKKLWRNAQDMLWQNLQRAVAQDLKDYQINWTDTILNRYGMEIVPIEQIESESQRRGWIKH